MPDETIASIAASVVSVGASSSRRQREHPRDVEGDVAVPDDDRALVREVELEVLEVGVAVVPGDELGGRPRSGKILAGDAQTTVGLRADRVDDRVVERRELVVRDVASHLARCRRSGSRDARRSSRTPETVFSCGMVGCDPETDEPPRRRQPLDHVDLDSGVFAREQCAGRVERGGPGADDRDTQRFRAWAAMLRPTLEIAT